MFSLLRLGLELLNWLCASISDRCDSHFLIKQYLTLALNVVTCSCNPTANTLDGSLPCAIIITLYVGHTRWVYGRYRKSSITNQPAGVQ